MIMTVEKRTSEQDYHMADISRLYHGELLKALTDPVEAATYGVK